MIESDKNNNGRIYAILSYIPFLCFVPLFKTNISSFAKHHVKQGLLLLIIEIIALLFLIDFISKLFWTIILIICLIVSLIGIFLSIAGKTFKIPFIYNLFKKYDI